jgi:hypothetical protein
MHTAQQAARKLILDFGLAEGLTLDGSDAVIKRHPVTVNR